MRYPFAGGIRFRWYHLAVIGFGDIDVFFPGLHVHAAGFKRLHLVSAQLLPVFQDQRDVFQVVPDTEFLFLALGDEMTHQAGDQGQRPVEGFETVLPKLQVDQGVQ